LSISFASILKVSIINKSRHPLPAYETTQSAGMDLRANIDEPIILQSLERTLIPTGLFIALPPGTEAQIRPRSGMAYKHGITVLNSPGTIDADYRGEIKVLIVNLSLQPVTISDGERIAQMVVAQHESVSWRDVDDLDDTKRGAGGFGSTGK
jgi:dUTP pyrophosphatase